MSFRFDFNIEEIDEEISPYATPSEETPQLQNTVAQEPFQELLLSHLLDALPSQMSYSPIQIPLSSGKNKSLARRDLFDARFQLISEGTGVPEDQVKETAVDLTDALAFIDQPSDLVPGVYEGGLKTWECSLDVVDYLNGLKENEGFTIQGKRVLEIGCGTAIPTVYLLNELFSSPVQEKPTEVHFQDYNASALDLVTFPNVILSWYMSPASAAFRNAVVPNEDETDKDANTLPPSDPSEPAELPITPELKAAFESSLHERHITLRFFSGSWSGFNLEKTGGKYDVVVTSETIYRTDSQPSLIDLMETACKVSDPDEQLGASSPSPCLCVVAAKIFYFGVGGGVTEFVQAVQKRGANVVTVWEQTVGVGRRIMRVSWK
ncbi:hypothetical protein Moror_17144 [Moniliophthora roreri MCA 2997]|uniref:protein-histidine N-methyltransferase n=2 Tax=Moniliophthora roreri TaxID=221103 RepID=V2X7J7_MONRO|nr:hypothetical protein Moror_17144 [Moniliophthora roreri MCA 2997]